MSLMNLLIAARSAYQGWRQRARAYDELMALDDRSLSDIGIHRSEIPGLVEGFHEMAKPPRLARDTEIGFPSPRHALLSPSERWLPPL